MGAVRRGAGREAPGAGGALVAPAVLADLSGRARLIAAAAVRRIRVRVHASPRAQAEACRAPAGAEVTHLADRAGVEAAAAVASVPCGVHARGAALREPRDASDASGRTEVAPRRAAVTVGVELAGRVAAAATAAAVRKELQHLVSTAPEQRGEEQRPGGSAVDRHGRSVIKADS